MSHTDHLHQTQSSNTELSGGLAGGFRCLVCGQSASESFLLRCRDRYLGKPHIVDYHRCTDCGLVQQFPIPADVTEFYEAYPIHQEKSRLYSLVRRLLMSGVYLRPSKLPRSTVLLDFGCGDGWYLQWCKQAGLTTVGFEPGAQHAEGLSRRLGINVFSDVDEIMASHVGGFDVITLHFVVEHLTELRYVIRSLRDLLKPGGIIRYVVPNIRSWEYHLFGRRWHSLDSPRHISFPDQVHARRLAAELSLRYEGQSSVPFPNGFGGSLPTALLGHFSFALFLATLPLSILVTRMFPSGNKAYVFRRPIDDAEVDN